MWKETSYKTRDNKVLKRFHGNSYYRGDSQVALVIKKPPVNSGDLRDVGSIRGSGISPGGGHDKLFQYSCLENPMDRGACWVMVHRVTKSQI